MKTIEEIIGNYDFGSDEINKSVVDLIKEYTQQKVSIAVEKALSACDKHISIYSQIDYNFTSIAPQILEELKGGEGYD